MKLRYQQAHMAAAFAYSQLSHCTRRQVGCVLVKDDSVIAIGFNGTPIGEDNTCEDCNGITKSTVIHAEENALRKLIVRTESSVGCHVFVTTSPCIYCAEKLVAARVDHVYYHDWYHNEDGIEYLQARGVGVTHLKIR